MSVSAAPGAALPPDGPPAGRAPAQVTVVGAAQRTVRRLILYGLLFALMIIAASGLSGLLGRVLLAGTELAADDVAGLALSLAFALIGGPLAAVLWWVIWRRLGDAGERSSAGWGLYLAALYLVALAVAAGNLLGAAASVLDRAGPEWRGAVATGLVWAALWAWHRWMLWHGRKRPVILSRAPTVLGAVFGLVLAAVGALGALSALFDAAILGTEASVGRPWWVSVLQSVIWSAGGVVLWHWHWKFDGARRMRGGIADVALITVGVLAAGIVTLGGTGVAVYVALRFLFDRSEAPRMLLEPLGPALAAAAVGALVWSYHRNETRLRAPATRHSARLVTSGVALAAAATGIGVIVNAVLALAVSPLAGSGARTLLLGGISSLAVGGPVWWLAWRPREGLRPAGAGLNARRVYLVAVFGLSAVVAVITLLVIGFRVFEFFLADVSGSSLIERIRAPLGLLAATALVAGYHFALWRRDRATLAAAGPGRSIGRIVLVAGDEPDSVRRAIQEATGAAVTVWQRADADGSAPQRAGAGLGADALGDRLAAALEGVSASKVLVVVDPDGRIDVVPLR